MPHLGLSMLARLFEVVGGERAYLRHLLESRLDQQRTLGSLVDQANALVERFERA
jgi:hypothetical protein